MTTKRPYHPLKLPVELNPTKFYRELVSASLEIGNLNGLCQNLPNPKILIAPLITKEATISSRIEGTRSTVSDVLKYEAGGEAKYEDTREVANYKRAVKIAPRFSRAYFRLGAIAEMQGKLKEARLNYEKALLYNTQNPEVYYNLGRVYFATKQYKKAASAFKRVRILAPATELADKAARYLKWLKGY